MVKRIPNRGREEGFRVIEIVLLLSLTLYLQNMDRDFTEKASRIEQRTGER